MNQELKDELTALMSPIIEEIIRIAPGVVAVTQQLNEGAPGAQERFALILAPFAQHLIEVSPKIVIAYRKQIGASLQ